MPVPQNVTAKILPHDPTAPALAKYPNWTTLPKQPITSIQADHRIETDIDVNGVGRVRVKPGYDMNVGEIRYTY